MFPQKMRTNLGKIGTLFTPYHFIETKGKESHELRHELHALYACTKTKGIVHNFQVDYKRLIIFIKSIPCSQRRTSIFGGIASFLAAICVRRVVLPMLQKNAIINNKI